MKHQLRNGSSSAHQRATSHRSETTWTVVGIGLGVFMGFSIGGIGIAIGGTFGIPGLSVPLILAIAFGLLGNRYGISRDRSREGARIKASL